MKSKVLLLHTKGVNALLSLSKDGPVHVTIGKRKTSGHMVKLEYDESEQSYIDWIISRAEEA